MWGEIMTKTENLLRLIKSGYSQILKDNLIGIYLHGSYVLGSYNYSVSDLDYLVVVKNPLSFKDKQQLMDFTTDNLWPIAPAKGLEFHVLLLKNTQHFSHPMPFDLHFSKAHYGEYLADKKRYLINMHGKDPDLAAHIMITNRFGKTLIGNPIDSVFSDVPKNIYWSSIYFDIASAKKEISEQPTYIILNLCRVLEYKKTQAITSKLDAGAWGIRFSPKYAAMIKLALQNYTNTNLTRKKFIQKDLDNFAKYMLANITE